MYRTSLSSVDESGVTGGTDVRLPATGTDRQSDAGQQLLGGSLTSAIQFCDGSLAELNEGLGRQKGWV